MEFQTWESWENSLEENAQNIYKDSLWNSIDIFDVSSEGYLAQWEEVLKLLTEVDTKDLINYHIHGKWVNQLGHRNLLVLFEEEKELKVAAKQELLYRKGKMNKLEKLSLPMSILMSK
jgi:hypothetical protein